MIKIKFNMDFHGEDIRNLEDLRNNFSVEDILEAYDNGLLVRWLDARYYTNELKQVQAIEAKNARGVLEDLIKIFSPETKQEEIDENLALYDYLEERRKYREYMKNSGVSELELLKRELEDVKQERDNRVRTLLQQLEETKHELREHKRNIEVLTHERDILQFELDDVKKALKESGAVKTTKFTIKNIFKYL